MDIILRQIRPAIVAPDRPDPHHRCGLPGCDHARRAGRVPVAGERVARHDGRRPHDRLEPHRAGLRRAEVRVGPPLVRRCGLRRERLGGLQPRARRARRSSSASRPTSSGCVPSMATDRSPSTSSPHPHPGSTRTSAPRRPSTRWLGWRRRATSDADEVRAVIARHTEQPLLGFIGQPRVNVLRVNLDLDGLLG